MAPGRSDVFALASVALFPPIPSLRVAASPLYSCHGVPCPNKSSASSHRRRKPDKDTVDDDDDRERRRLTLPPYHEYFKNEVEVWIERKRTAIENSIFVSYDPQGYAYRSASYRYDDFLETLYSMSVEGVGGGDDQILFYVGQMEEDVVRGLVNVAAFLAHAMAVSIKYDVCDEFNRDKTDNTQKYAISNSCGQWGRTYHDEVCEGSEASFTCEMDPDMAITAADSITGENAPPPLTCRPREGPADFTGHWDAELGVLNEKYPYANRAGVQHVEGCCWWGRGVLMTRGTCSFGRANGYLGRLAAQKGFINYYDVDICIYPEIVCEGEDTMGLRWSVGYFEWADRVQTYQNPTEGLDYMRDLNTFIDSGFVDVNRFIDVVGKALSFGCAEDSCVAAENQVKQERRDNFLQIVYNVFDLPYLVETTPFPLPPPTNKPMADSIPPPTQEPTRRPRTPRPNPLPTTRPTMNIFISPEPTTLIPTKHPTKLSTSSPTTAFPTKFPTSRPSKFQAPVTTAKPTTNPTIGQILPLPTSKPTIGQTSPPQDTLTKTVCGGQSSAFMPVEECRQFVQCANGIMVSKQSCAAGLLFDSKLNLCNWKDIVVCTAPTKTPTPEPTQQVVMPGPTGQQTQQVTMPGPTGQQTQQVAMPGPSGQQTQQVTMPGPTGQQTQQVAMPGPTGQQTQQVAMPGQTGQQAQQPAPKPTQYTFKPTESLSPPPAFPSPTRPTAIPALVNPPFDYTSQSNGQSDERNPPINSQKPTNDDGSLIILPTNASLVMGSNAVLSIGILWMAWFGCL